MASHLSSIGFPVKDQAALWDLAVIAAKRGKTYPVSNGAYIQWQDQNGAEIWIQLDEDGKIIGLNPHFAGKGRLRAGLIKTVSHPNANGMDGAYYGWADPADEKRLNLVHVPLSSICLIFCSIHYIFANASTFSYQLSPTKYKKRYIQNKERDINLLRFTRKSLICGGVFHSGAGLFSPKKGSINPPEARAIFTGRVIQCSYLKNSLTGAKFHWALVRTLGGEIDSCG